MSYLINNEGKITNVKYSQVSSISQQQSTSAWVDVTGSSVSYTPTVGSDYVLYECTLYLGANSGDVYGKFQIYYSDDNGSNWSAPSNSAIAIGSDQFDLNLVGLFTLTHLISTWGSTERLFKLQFRRGGGSSTECDLHQLPSFRGVGGVDSTTNYYKPVIMCSSITNSKD